MELDLYRPIEVLFPEGALMDHVYVAMREGQVIRFEDSPHAETYEITLDITDRVRNFGTHQGGFMSAAFHPDFDLNGELYVFYLHSEEPDELDAPWSSRLSRFTSFDGGATFGDDTEEIILDEPRVYVYHHGGHLAFDPDGYLLLSLGDGGGSLDPFRYGQDPFHLFASIIRIDVDGGVPYAIPPDNPFADGYEGAPEVYAYGLRNAHQFSFDSLTGELWAADVGSMAFEEVNRIEPGGNYGWRVGEGHSCFADPASCDDPAIIDPVYTYRNVGVSSIIGGAVYRGTLMPELDGHYVFADHFLEGPVSALAPDGMGGWEVHSLIRDSKTQLSTWTQGRDGELYAVDHYKALIKTLVPATTNVPRHFPEWISETGCMDDADPTQPGPMLIPYDINAPFWSDDAVKNRWVALPDGSSITIDASLDLEFPRGTVLVKDFRVDGELVETRLLKHHDDGRWSGTAYAWLPDFSDAHRVDYDLDHALLTGGTRQVPGTASCEACHAEAQGFSLGPELGQIEKEFAYPDGRTANQIDTWQHLGFFDADPGDPSTLFVMPDPTDDVRFTLEERAHSYLNTNCGQCHVVEGTGASSMELDYESGIESYCGTKPFITDMGVADARHLYPGEPEQSLIWLRIDDTDNGFRMPPVGSHMRDDVGAQLIYDYIASLTDCP